MYVDHEAFAIMLVVQTLTVKPPGRLFNRRQWIN